MPDLDLKPSEYRKSEPAGPILIIWFVLCYCGATYAALATTSWNWKAVVAAQLGAFVMGYLVAKRFRVERTPAGRNR